MVAFRVIRTVQRLYYAIRSITIYAMTMLSTTELSFRYPADHALNNLLGGLDVRVLEIGYTTDAAPWLYLTKKNICDPWYRIYYMDDRSGYLQLGDQLVELEPGHLHLLPAHLDFHYETKVLPSHLWLHFFSDRLQQFLPCRLYSSPFDDQELFRRILDSIQPSREETAHQTIEHNFFCRSLLNHFLEQEDFLTNLANDAIPANLRRTVDFIRQNFCEALSIEDLAAVAKLPPSQFSLQFAKYYGMPPKRYCINFRISQAKILLMQTNLATKEIAERCGFQDCYYFYRIFKENVGFTPSQYRLCNKVRH